MPPRSLSLPGNLARRVLSGYPVLDTRQIPSPATSLDPGRPLVLIDERGEVLGSGVADPENDVVRVLSDGAVDTFDQAFFHRKLEPALALREALGLVDGESAYRLINAEGDGLSGFVADVYGEFVVLYVYSRGLLNLGRLLAAAILERTGALGVVLKVRPRGGPKPGQVKQETLGKEPAQKLVVKENGIPFEVHLLGGLNVGLFTDMREQRTRIGPFVAGRRVLNTFAYTGAISVTSALAGAREVTSVDLSSGVLKWARENFRLAGLDPEAEAYRFEADDVMRFLREQADRGTRYDTIILDPPTYSAARASAWSMKNDYPDLIALAASLLPDKGVGFLWISANVRRGKPLVQHIEEGFRKCRRTAKVLATGGLPPDYPTTLAYPEGRYLEICHVAVFS